MNILVTGGTGFLGRHIVWRLANQGHKVVFTGRNQQAANNMLVEWQAQQNSDAHLLSQNQPEFLALAHEQRDAPQKILEYSKGIDTIIHCAALSSPWGKKSSFQVANIDATKHVVDACKKNQIPRLIHISTPSIYFDYKDQFNITEDQVLPKPVNEYARTKRIAEYLVLDSSIEHKIILRPRAIFGPWDTTLLPRLLRLLKYGRVPLLREGHAHLDMTYIANLVDAIENSLTVELNKHGITPIFNISNGQPIQAKALFKLLSQKFLLPIQMIQRPYIMIDKLARLLEIISSISGYWEPPITRYSIATIAFSHTLNIDKAKQYLNYQPHISIPDGIEKTAQWWLNQTAKQGNQQ